MHATSVVLHCAAKSVKVFDTSCWEAWHTGEDIKDERECRGDALIADRNEKQARDEAARAQRQETAGDQSGANVSHGGGDGVGDRYRVAGAGNDGGNGVAHRVPAQDAGDGGGDGPENGVLLQNKGGK